MRAPRLRAGSALAALGLACAFGAEAGPPETGVIGHPTAQRSEAAFMRAGDSAMAAGDFPSAVAFYRRASDIAPRDPVAPTRLAGALVKCGADAEALAAYGQAHALAPQSAEIDLAMGKLALGLDRPQDALSDFQAAGHASPSAAAWNGMGVAEDALGDHAQAQADYRKGLEASPHDRPLRNNLALSQALSGRYADAVATLSALLSEPGASAGERLNLALVYGLQGDDDKAAHAAREVLGEADNAANRRYYALLRAMDDRTRTRAIMGLGAPPPTVAPAAPGPARPGLQ